MSNPLRLLQSVPPDPLALLSAYGARCATERELVLGLARHDPFDLYASVCRRVDERALLLDEETVTRRARAACALAARDYDGEPALADWVLAHVDRVIESLLEEDLEAEHQGPDPDRREFRFEFITDCLGRPADDGRALCNRFNALPDGPREAFYEVHIKGTPPARYGQRASLSRVRVQGLLARATALLGRAGDPRYTEHPALSLAERVAETIGSLDSRHLAPQPDPPL